MGCGACCIAPSISSAIPGMPNGKSSGVKCIQLGDTGLCKIFADSARPAVCADFKASIELCGSNADEALNELFKLEQLTA